jgi:S-adenosylmethionine/arginine decarboxylase-like enzyme
MLEHQHIIIRAEICNPPVDIVVAKAWLSEVVNGIGMKLAAGLECNPNAYYCELEGNRGLTCMAILETSHCVAHFWDDVNPGIMQFDLYSCSCIEVEQILEFLEPFQPLKVEYKFLDRNTELRDLGSETRFYKQT